MNDIHNSTTESLIFTGTSNLVLPVPNRAAYPEAFRDKSRLEYYASLFNSVEINSSFKKVPMYKTVARWADSVPPGFRFTFKLWKGVTHNKDLVFQPRDVEHFMGVISAAGRNKGCLLVQFPGSLTINAIGQVEQLLLTSRQVDPNCEWNVALEFRNRSWYQADVFALLIRHHAGLVLHDMPGSSSMDADPLAGFVYLRFHGTEKNYRGTYPDALLNEYAERIKTWSSSGRAVYVYFNNTLGDAVQNLITLNRMLTPRVQLSHHLGERDSIP